MLTDELVKKTLDKALQLANVASDWNLSEVEIDGEMVDIYDLTGEFEAAVAAARRGRQLLPDDVGDAIAGLIGFACNPSHMDKESLAMAYTAAKWLDRQRVPNEGHR
jgi:hypothetical protein